MSKKLRMLLCLLCLALAMTACGSNEGGSSGDKGSQMSWQDHYDLGIRLLSEGNYEEAIVAFMAAIDIDPKNVEAYTALADVYVKADRMEDAKDILQQGIDNCNQSGMSKQEGQEKLFIAIADLWIQTGDREEAKRILVDAIDGDNQADKAELYIKLAEMELEEGNKDAAVNWLQEGIDSLPEKEKDKLIQYAKELGYELDENGVLVDPNGIGGDLAAELEGMDALQKAEYLLDNGNNATHWCFADRVYIGGYDFLSMTMDEVAEVSIRMGWGVMEEESSLNGMGMRLETERPRGDDYVGAGLAGAEGRDDYVDFISVGSGLYDAGSRGDAKIEEGIGAKLPIGIYEIRLGDSLPQVMEQLGWENGRMIGELLVEAAPSGYEIERRVVNPVLENGEPEPGTKIDERLTIYSFDWGDYKTIDIRINLYFYGGFISDREFVVDLTFRDDLGYGLAGVMVMN